jgi:hypothetical protein
MKNSFAQFENRLREFMRSDSSDAFESLALELFRLQFTHNLPYRRFCEAERRTPDSVRAWNEIPAIPTSAFKELELSSIPLPERTAEFHSSGTTQQRPSRHFHHRNSLAIYEASAMQWAQRHLPLTKGSVVFLTPPAADAPHSSLAHMFETICRNAADVRSAFLGQLDSEGAWTLQIPRIISLLTVCANSDEPVGLLGTAFNFVHLFDALRERKLHFQLPRGSWALETGGYKGRSRSLSKAELHQHISGFLGIDLDHIVCEYGMSELSSQAYDVSLVHPSIARRSFKFPPWARAQVISPETGREVSEGEIGLLRVYDLANIYSVMAIETEDLALRREDGFELVGRVQQAEPRGCSLMTA